MRSAWFYELHLGCGCYKWAFVTTSCLWLLLYARFERKSGQSLKRLISLRFMAVVHDRHINCSNSEKAENEKSLWKIKDFNLTNSESYKLYLAEERNQQVGHLKGQRMILSTNQKKSNLTLILHNWIWEWEGYPHTPMAKGGWSQNSAKFPNFTLYKI